MTDTNQPNDLLQFEDGQKPELPTGLKVLTILTIIGSILGLLGGVWTYIKADESYKKLEEAQGNMDSAPAFVKKMMGPDMLEMARKSAENKLPIMLLTLIGSALCLYGAMEMRKLKKQGFMLWVVGEFLPIIGGIVFLGFGMFNGFAAIGMLFPLVFLILYAVQKKYLVN